MSRTAGRAVASEAALDEPTVRAVVRQAARDVRTAAPPPPTDPPADSALAALRPVVDDLVASTRAIGELMLEVAPAYQSDTGAADVLSSTRSRSMSRSMSKVGLEAAGAIRAH